MTADPRSRRHAALLVTAIALCLTMLLPGCSTMVTGHAVSMLYDPFRVGGLPAEDGPSGPKADAPQPSGTVDGATGGDIDHLALLSVNDIEEFWRYTYPDAFPGRPFLPVKTLASYDAKDPTGATVCGEKTFKFVNAFFAGPCNLIAWDRGVLLPTAQKFFGDMAVTGLLAHEYGHAIQRMANLVSRKDPGLVLEQQADCFAGTYLRWVAEGHSRRFTISTGDGLNHVLAGILVSRDPTITPDEADMIEEGHGTALDRISAFQMGFDTGTTACADINMDEITHRRGDLPLSLQADPSGEMQTGEVAITGDTLTTLADILGTVYKPARKPTVSLQPGNCPDATTTPPVSYCPATNTITVDLPALQQLGRAQDESSYVLLQGDNTALSIFTSRYALAVQHDKGLPLDSAVSALRTACLTGFAQRSMSSPIDTASGQQLVLTAGDLDEATAGLLTNGVVASDVNGSTAPAGFTRIMAYRSGLLGTAEQCYQRFAGTTVVAS
jgi:predicted metalloprotease